MMIPAAIYASKSYNELSLPIIIVAGEDDRLIDIDEQSGRLHSEVKQSKMHRSRAPVTWCNNRPPVT